MRNAMLAHVEFFMEGCYHILDIIFLSIHKFDLSTEVFDFCMKDTFSRGCLDIDLTNSLFIHSDLFEFMISLALVMRVKYF